MFNIHINKNSRKQQAIWKNLHGTPEQPTSVECGYYVMRFMRDIIHDPDLNFEKKVKRNILDILSLFYYVIFLFKTVVCILITRRFFGLFCSLTRKKINFSINKRILTKLGMNGQNSWTSNYRRIIDVDKYLWTMFRFNLVYLKCT